MMKPILIAVSLMLVLTFAATGQAADSVSVQSMTVARGATGVEIPVRIHNDSRVRIVTIPLEFRSTTPGAFITGLGVSFRDRLTDSLSDLRVINQYATKNGFCKPTGGDAYTGYIAAAPDSMISVTSQPWGLVVSAISMAPSVLPPGDDTMGSIILTVDVTDTSGTFEIDTTCVAPANVIVYITTDEKYARPAFSKGVITIDPCNCSYHADLDGNGAIDGVDLSSLIDWVYSSIGPPPTDPSCPHIDRGDVDCSGADDAVDVSLMIDIVFFGSTACEPCSCNPYPTSCP